MKVVGVTSCPAGIAHTPMAAKALEVAGKELGLDIKIEQQGSMGHVNEITKEEAQASDLVIFATTLVVEGSERFEGKPTIRVNINQCIASPKAVLTKCIEAVEAKKK
jgi:PTS system fructose-specific IIB component